MYELTMEQLIFLCKAARHESFPKGGKAAEIKLFIEEYHPKPKIDSRYLLLKGSNRGGLESLVNEKLASGWRLHGSPIIESKSFYQGVYREI